VASRVDPPASVHDIEACGLVVWDVGTEYRATHDALLRLLAAVSL
jgi:phage terminase large subunit-like protein